MGSRLVLIRYNKLSSLRRFDMKKFFDAFGFGGGLFIAAIMVFSLAWWAHAIGDFLINN